MHFVSLRQIMIRSILFKCEHFMNRGLEIDHHVNTDLLSIHLHLQFIFKQPSPTGFLVAYKFHAAVSDLRWPYDFFKILKSHYHLDLILLFHSLLLISSVIRRFELIVLPWVSSPLVADVLSTFKIRF